MKILSFRAINFRGFVDTGHFMLRQINLLVGKNSIGKSSYARLWPIFNQGSKLQKRTPVLWNGDLVDFGTFQNVLSRHATNSEVGFEFSMELEKRDLFPSLSSLRISTRIKYLTQGAVKFKITLTSEAGDLSRTRCTGFTINANNLLITYSFGEDGFLVAAECNGTKVKPGNSLKQESSIGFLIPVTEFFVIFDGRVIPTHSPMQLRLLGFLRTYLHQRLSIEKIRDIAAKLNVFGTGEDLLKYCGSLPYEYKTWKDFLKVLEKNIELMERFQEIVMLAASDNLLKDIDLSLRQYFSTVSYIRPLRATAQRYYRKQELAVDNIDAEGGNLAFFLASLTAPKLARLNEWLADTIDVEVRLEGEQGHVMINLLDNTTGRVDNMADMGFGFSQVLPLAVQAWISSSVHARSSGRAQSASAILVWEQPELHLHPAMQRKLARLIARTATLDVRKNIKFIIETHSQSMINEFGDLILENSMKAEDIQILLFDQRASGETFIETAEFDEEGQLMNWPYGFLSV